MSDTTATRIRPLGRAITLVAFAAAWLVAAYLLWQTSVPASVDTDGLDERRYFAARALDRAHDYSQGERLLWVLSTLAAIAALVALVKLLPRHVHTLGLGRIGSAIVVGMVVLVGLWFVQLPFGLAALWWQHHWGLGPFNVLEWLVAQRYALGATAVFALVAIVVVVGFAGRFGRRWWIPAAPLFVVLAAAFAFVAGWLLSVDTHSIRDAELRRDVARMERAVGIDPPVKVQEVSEWTDQANAFAAGYGPSTNVVLWDTLLDGEFSDREVRAVVAHELAHVKKRHVPKGLMWFALLALPMAFAVAELTQRRGGLEDPANLPYALLVLTVIGLVAAPFQNIVSRRYEAEADWIALRATKDPASVKELFRSFEDTSLSEPNPPTWAYVWLSSHPTLMQRIAMAERYPEQSRSGP